MKPVHPPPEKATKTLNPKLTPKRRFNRAHDERGPTYPADLTSYLIGQVMKGPCAQTVK